jgi:DNA-binding PadR family transcriptional regulator
MSPTRALSPTLVHILLSLADGVRHGYAIKREIEQRTEGAIRLGPASLYESIQRLERAGLISAASQPAEQTDARPNRRYYRITDGGRAALNLEVRRLAQIVDHARTRSGLKGEST